MRAYFWGNYYLSSIQQGIQSLHTLGNMFVKYEFPRVTEHDLLLEWAEKHKTVVIMNAGDSHDLHEIAHLFKDAEDCRYPWATFTEEGIMDALTCVGVVVDDHIIKAVDKVRAARKERRRFAFPERLNAFDYELVMLIASSLLAR